MGGRRLAGGGVPPPPPLSLPCTRTSVTPPPPALRAPPAPPRGQAVRGDRRWKSVHGGVMRYSDGNDSLQDAMARRVRRSNGTENERTKGLRVQSLSFGTTSSSMGGRDRGGMRPRTCGAQARYRSRLETLRVSRTPSFQDVVLRSGVPAMAISPLSSASGGRREKVVRVNLKYTYLSDRDPAA